MNGFSRAGAERGTWRRALLFGWAVAVVLLPPAQAIARDIEQIESVGAASIAPDVSNQSNARDRAVRNALVDAVRRSAFALAPITDERDSGLLVGALGNDPYQFATRFRVLEDRGVQPALFSSNPDVVSEYRVIVEVSVDRDLIRERLVSAGLMSPPSGTPVAIHTRLSLEGLQEYRVYETIRLALLDDVGARSAVPVEATSGRMVIEVDSAHSGFDLLEALEDALPPEFELIPLQVDGELLQLRVSVRDPTGSDLPADPVDQPPGNAELVDPIDTTERNRY